VLEAKLNHVRHHWPLDVIGPIREEMQKVLNDYQQDKAREKNIQAEIGRKRVIAQMRATNPTFDYEDSPSLHSVWHGGQLIP
jgi:hypothetical protein